MPCILSAWLLCFKFANLSHLQQHLLNMCYNIIELCKLQSQFFIPSLKYQRKYWYMSLELPFILLSEYFYLPISMCTMCNSMFSMYCSQYLSLMYIGIFLLQ